MKLKFLIAVPVIILLVFVANWSYGNVASKKLDKQLRFRIENSMLPIELKYDKVKVNPLFSEVTFYNATFSLLDGDVNVISEMIAIKIPYRDAKKLAETQTLDEIKSFDITFLNSVLDADNDKLEVEKMFLDYDGYLTRAEMENLENSFPKHKQELYCQLNNVKVQNKNFLNDMNFLINEDGRLVKEAKFELTFDPEESKIELSDLSITNDIIKSKAEADVEYEGDGFNNFSPLKIDFEYNSSNGSNKIVWGDPSITGRYSISKIRHNYKGVLSRKFSDALSLNNIDELTMTLLIEDVNVDYKGNAKKNIENQLSMLGIKTEDISIEEFKLNTNVENNEVTISDTKLVSPLINADLKADISLNQDDFDSSEIHNLKLVIEGLSPKLDAKINELSAAFGINIPRENGDIVFDVTGTIGNPNVKGLK